MPIGRIILQQYILNQEFIARIQKYIIDPKYWALATILVGFTGLFGWIFSFRHLVAIIPQSVSVAPVSAILFIFIGISLYIHEHSKADPQYSAIHHSLLIISLILAVWGIISIFVGNPAGINWEGYTSEQVSWITPQGQMSPISSMLFLILISGIVCRQYCETYGKAVSVIITVTGAVMILGYWFGAPFFYGESIKPVSFLTAAGFFLSGVSFMLLTCPSAIDEILHNVNSIHSQILLFFVPFIIAILLIEGWVISFFLKKTDSTLVLTIATITLISIIVTVIFSSSFSRIITANVENANKKRMAAEKALLDSLIRVKIATDAAKMGFGSWDLIEDKITWDDRMYELFGIREKKPITIPDIMGTIHPDDHPEIFSLEAIKEKTEFHTEFRIILSDSQVKTIESHGKVIPGDDGEPERVVSVSLDITPKIEMIETLNQKNEQLSQTYEELAAQEEELRSQYRELAMMNDEVTNTHRFIDEVISQAGEGIIVLDKNGIIKTWNQFMEDFTGFTSKEMIGRIFSDSILELVPCTDSQCSSCTKEERPGIFSDNSFIRSSDGCTKWYSATSTPHHDITGKLSGTIIIIKDITDRKEFENKLTQSESLLKASQELAKIGGFEYNLQTKETFWTDETYRIFGLNPDFNRSDELIPTILSCLLEPEKELLIQAIKNLKETGESYELELPAKTIKGDQIWIRTQARGEWLGGQISKIQGTYMDITREKDLEKEKTIAIKQVQRNFAELAMLNDGIRNPLTIISMMTENHNQKLYSDVEVQIKKIDQIVNQLDARWIESESVLNYIQKHYNIQMKPADLKN